MTYNQSHVLRIPPAPPPIPPTIPPPPPNVPPFPVDGMGHVFQMDLEELVETMRKNRTRCATWREGTVTMLGDLPLATGNETAGSPACEETELIPYPPLPPPPPSAPPTPRPPMLLPPMPGMGNASLMALSVSDEGGGPLLLTPAFSSDHFNYRARCPPPCTSVKLTFACENLNATTTTTVQPARADAAVTVLRGFAATVDQDVSVGAVPARLSVNVLVVASPAPGSEEMFNATYNVALHL